MLQGIMDQFKQYVDCYIVYLKEIHPADEWYIGGDEVSTCFKQPTSMQQRVKIVEALQEYAPFVKVPFLVDLMDNNFNVGFDAVPERLYVIENNKFSYIGGPGPFHFIPEELVNYLDQRFPSASTPSQ